MTDPELVERLWKCSHATSDPDVRKLAGEAADELERLRKGVEHVKLWLMGDRLHMSEEHFVYAFGYYFLTPEERERLLTPEEVTSIKNLERDGHFED